jgi:hypothetical protein
MSLSMSFLASVPDRSADPAAIAAGRNSVVAQRGAIGLHLRRPSADAA